MLLINYVNKDSIIFNRKIKEKEISFWGTVDGLDKYKGYYDSCNQDFFRCCKKYKNGIYLDIEEDIFNPKETDCTFYRIYNFMINIF